MNELYERNKREINMTDFQGGGIGSGHYDEAEEKRNAGVRHVCQSLLLVGLFICLLMTTFLVVKEANYYFNGTADTARCNSSGSYAAFDAPDGHSYSVESFWAFTKNDTVKVYYFGDQYYKAAVMTNYKIWVLFYVFFGGLTALVVRWLLKILRPKQHAACESKDQSGAKITAG